jgi:alpha-N-arabinofuranosidase
VLTRVSLRGTLAALALATTLPAAEFHVAIRGDDQAPGTDAAPFRTIQHAADVAQPGDTITVHTGVYRERVNPPRGGTSDDKRITYRSAPGEHVEIAGSESVTGWTNVQGDTWSVTLPNTFFGTFNPYADVLHGDWFEDKGRVHHTGAVYLNGAWLSEAATLDEVLKPVGDTPLWFARVDAKNTTLWAQCKGINPNADQVEINVRRTVFYPDRPGRNYITVQGFVLRDGATPWAPPTAEQIGIIGTNWSKGWVIENNVISHSICCGVSLGKYGDAFDNTSANSAEGYIATIKRAQAFTIPWTKEAVGDHLVRNNTISECEQAGIIGSLGCAFSTITGNTIHDIHVRRRFSGAEMAGIKLHGAIDVVISHNNIYRTNRGIWLDWMAQGTRVTANLFHDNGPSEDLFFEVDHGPYMVDNNVFLSPVSILDISEGGAYAHNLITGRVTCLPDLNRDTPYLRPHTTTLAGLAKVEGGDDRYYNNLFVARPEKFVDDSDWGRRIKEVTAFGLCGYDRSKHPLQTGGNVYLNGACAYANEKNVVKVAGGFTWKLTTAGSHLQLELRLPETITTAATPFVTTRMLGRTRVANAEFERADGSVLSIDEDYFGKRRDPRHPTSGPFELDATGVGIFKVW